MPARRPKKIRNSRPVCPAALMAWSDQGARGASCSVAAGLAATATAGGTLRAMDGDDGQACARRAAGNYERSRHCSNRRQRRLGRNPGNTRNPRGKIPGRLCANEKAPRSPLRLS